MRKLLPLFASLFMLAGCGVDSCVGKLEALGDSARVTCYSGTKLIYDGCSTGKVESQSSSDGYFFRDATTRRPVEVSGNCVLDYRGSCPQKSYNAVNP